MALLLTLLGPLGCTMAAAGGPRGEAGEPPRGKDVAVQQTSVSGLVSVDGAPRAGVEVVLLGGGGEPQAFQASDAGGRFSFAAPGFAGGWVMARLFGDPVVGVAVVPVKAGAKEVTLAVAAAAAVTLSLDVAPPPGVAFDWADVHVSPRGLPGVPDEVVAAAGLVGIGPSRRASYHRLRITQPRVRLRLLPGSWSVTVDHLVDRPTTPRRPPPNWAGDRLTLPDGRQLPATLRAHRLTLSGDLHAAVTTAVVAD